MFACSWVSSVVSMYSLVLKCYYNNLSDPEMQGFWKLIMFIGRYSNLAFLWHQGRNLRATMGDCKLATPINFIRGTLAGKLDSFQLNIISIIFPLVMKASGQGRTRPTNCKSGALTTRPRCLLTLSSECDISLYG